MNYTDHTKTVLVSGASGLVGRALCADLLQNGYAVRRLSRSGASDVSWNVERAELSPAALDGVDFVIHLAGEPIAQRWTRAVQKRILDSRVQSTQLLVREILKQKQPPVFICASGINYYGHQCSEPVDESAAAGEGFLAQVCCEWEAAAEPLIQAGVRTVFVRTGIVLSRSGGALAKMLPPFKLALGGRIGSGRQHMSWIGLADLVAIYRFAMNSDSLSGPINAVAPRSISNLRFTVALGQALGRPTYFPVPALVIKMLFGEMADETLLADLAVAPERLQQLGFTWESGSLAAALDATLSTTV